LKLPGNDFPLAFVHFHNSRLLVQESRKVTFTRREGYVNEYASFGHQVELLFLLSAERNPC
jgi:hypothetical protein